MSPSQAMRGVLGRMLSKDARKRPSAKSCLEFFWQEANAETKHVHEAWLKLVFRTLPTSQRLGWKLAKASLSSLHAGLKPAADKKSLVAVSGCAARFSQPLMKAKLFHVVSRGTKVQHLASCLELLQAGSHFGGPSCSCDAS